MGRLNTILGSRIYLDANVLIYAFEDWPQFSGQVRALFRQIDAGKLHAMTSEISLAEILVKPIRDADTNAQARYQDLFNQGALFEPCEVSRRVLVAAAGLRASSSLKLPDAIHAATALSRGCTTFITNDQRFEAVSGLPVLPVSDLPR